MRYLLVLTIISVTLFCCKSAGQKTSEETSTAGEFIKNIESHCGKSFYGKVLFPENPEAPFNAENSFMVFESCTEEGALTPFIPGNEMSGIWVLTVMEDSLIFKHDNRHDDGTPDDITMYGGYADNTGTALMQNFPAGEETALMTPEAPTNVWTFQFNEDLTEFHYILKRHNALRFHVVFDLASPREI